MFFFDKKIISNVNKLFGFIATGYEQDWPLEFADKNRISEFINAIKLGGLSPDVRNAIVSLILFSYDDYLSEKVDHNNEIWKEIIVILNESPNSYKDVLNYWALWDNKANDLFKLTPLVRSYLKEL